MVLPLIAEVPITETLGSRVKELRMEKVKE